jgi:hypothetical protein
MHVPGLVLVTALAFGAGYCEGLKNTPTEPPACDAVAGSYKLSYTTTCNKSGNAIPATVTQSACQLRAELDGIGTLTGTLKASTADVTIAFSGPCGGAGTGTLKHDGHSLTGSYSGAQTGASCCPTVAGTFTLSQ